MIGLQQYINEAYNEKKYGLLLDRVDLKGVTDQKKMAKLIKDGLEQAMTRYKVIRVEAVEKYNKKSEDDWNADFAKAIEKEEQRVIAYMKTKPGIMKRKPEKQQKYIDDKIEKFKKEWPAKHKKWLANIDFEEKYMRVYFYDDIHNGHSKREFSNQYHDNDSKAAQIAGEIVSKQEHDDAWKSLESLFITVEPSNLTRSWISFNVYPEFPEDVQKGLDKEIERFCDFMCGEYDSGRYMGD